MARVIKQYRLVLIFLSVVIILGGCSSRDLYNAAQQNRLQECSKLYGAQRADCEARYQKDFDTYQREREEVLNTENP